MILKEYQKRALNSVSEFLQRLAEWRAKQAKVLEADPDTTFDWVSRAWEATVPARPYLPRRNGLGEPLPAFCLKIPTGGGKTLLATKIIDLANVHYRRDPHGLVLWVVPTTQIYNQTLRALKDRGHPYRQQVDLASGGRTLVLEKTSGFSPRDVADNLCILLLMLPSANRETKAQLRMFRDSGGFDRFFPAEDDVQGQQAFLKRTPNLDTFEQEGDFWGRQVKTSLGNTLRVLRPLIVLDEGHKAYSRNAKATLEGFNPCLIVELSATPPTGANVLINISGQDLNKEEMIKLDLRIRNLASTSWKDTLLASIEHRQRLEVEARRYEADTGEYIRPICLVQVERTGRDQRRTGVVHAEDVREYLLHHPDIARNQVAVKTSQKDELKEVDEVGGLMSRDCPIRFIITKQALQEGWDCAFAYVLTILTNPGSKSALTQLVGRILRQPRAKKTRVAWLDESYVFCFQRRGNELLKEVRRGFGLEGLGDLQGRVVQAADGPLEANERTVRQRERYRKATEDLVLPAFMVKDGKEWRLVHYEADILSRTRWDDVNLQGLLDLPLGDEIRRDTELRAGLGTVPLTADTAPAAGWTPAGGEPTADYAFAASHLLDVMPNPWRGYELIRRTFDALIEKYPREQVVGSYVFVLDELHKHLVGERDRLARGVFKGLLDDGTMRFVVVTRDLGFNRLPRAVQQPVDAKQVNRTDGSPYQRDLLERMVEGDLNELEHKVATYLDQQERLFFWYRNRPRHDYFVQGWKRGRIYADFLATLRPDEPDVDDAFHRVFVIETKGIHLKQAADTAYKRSVFDICSEHARKADWAEFVPAMSRVKMRFEIVDEEEWEKRLNAMFAE
ncbi:MAG: restriction endonuclease subunit R [Acidobacteria bacterium]|nr:restriction endonuclease subunit R [Acidobacteriota bacterium]MYJ04214.1 restriction endonuclease subunit R [Acidobacteriota bacterium]